MGKMLSFLDGRKLVSFDQVNKTRKCYTASVDEGRKRGILIAAAILAARKLSSCDPDRRVPASITAISELVKWAAQLMREIDERWPERKGN